MFLEKVCRLWTLRTVGLSGVSYGSSCLTLDSTGRYLLEDIFIIGILLAATCLSGELIFNIY